MLLIAELLHQTAVVCNSITASHHAETAGEHLERRYATVGKRHGAFANNACEGGSSGLLSCPGVFYLKRTPCPVVFGFDRPPPTAGFFKRQSAPPVLQRRRPRVFTPQRRLPGFRQEGSTSVRKKRTTLRNE